MALALQRQHVAAGGAAEQQLGELAAAGVGLSLGTSSCRWTCFNAHRGIGNKAVIKFWVTMHVCEYEARLHGCGLLIQPPPGEGLASS
jgi:hypothetical protein